MAKRKHKTTAHEIKEFKFHGLTFEQVTELKLDEFIKLIPSRERRTIKRGFTEIEKKLIKKAKKAKPNDFIKTHARDAVILPEFVGKRFGIHNGKEFVAVDISEEMIGHRLGEFAQTRKSVKHTGPGMGATRSSKFVPLK